MLVPTVTKLKVLVRVDTTALKMNHDSVPNEGDNVLLLLQSPVQHQAGLANVFQGVVKMCLYHWKHDQECQLSTPQNDDRQEVLRSGKIFEKDRKGYFVEI